MDRPNRPYKGMQAEQDELEARLYGPKPVQDKSFKENKTTMPTSYKKEYSSQDSVIEAAKTCLIIGGGTCIFGIGLAFFPAAFVLGIYAMATNRIRQGVIISIASIALSIVATLIVQTIWWHIVLRLLSGSFPRFAISG